VGNQEVIPVTCLGISLFRQLSLEVAPGLRILEENRAGRSFLEQNENP
jgi:hypothetical protein